MARLGVATRAAAWALPLFVAALFYADFIARSGFTFQGRTYFVLFDDSMISMRYARNLVDGHGLVWNAGQHIEGYSNFLWTLWLALLHLLPISDRAMSLPVMLSGVVLIGLLLVVVRRLCAHLVPESPGVGWVAVVLVAFSFPLVYWALSGLEVALAALLVTCGALLVLRLRDAWSSRHAWRLAAVLAAAVLTRDDLLVPSAVLLAFAAWQVPPAWRSRVLGRVGGAVAAAFMAHLVFRLAYYGNALPNTYYLKLGGIPIGDRLRRGADSLAYTWLYTLYAPLLLAAAAVVQSRGRLRTALVLPAALFLAQCAYSLYVGGDAWETLKFANRYIATALPLLFVTAAVGLHLTLRRAGLRRAAVVAAGFVVAGLLLATDWLPTDRLGFSPGEGVFVRRTLVAFAAAAAVMVLPLLRRGRRGPLPSWAPAAALVLVTVVAMVAMNAKPASDWSRSLNPGRTVRGWVETGVLLREHTAPNVRVALFGAGSSAYFSHREGVDLLGKMDTTIAHEDPQPVQFRPGHDKWDYWYSVGGLRPEVLSELWYPTAADLCNISRWGYVQIAPRFYVRRGAPGVDTSALARDLGALHLAPRFPSPANCSTGTSRR